MKKVFLTLIGFYRKHLTHRKLYATCKFIPTCSEYAMTAIERYGAFKGGFMSLWRLIRCSPLTRGGYDPVPEKKKK